MPRLPQLQIGGLATPPRGQLICQSSSRSSVHFVSKGRDKAHRWAARGRDARPGLGPPRAGASIPMSWGAALLGTRLCSSTRELREAVLWDLGGGFLTGDMVHCFLYFQPPWVRGCAHSPGTSESLSYGIWGEVYSWRHGPLFPPLPAPLGMWLCSPT